MMIPSFVPWFLGSLVPCVQVTTREAQETLDRWYEDRPEVKQWQADVIARAHQTGYTRTLMGRYRHLPDIASKSR